MYHRTTQLACSLVFYAVLATPVSSQGVDAKAVESIVGDSDIRQEQATTSAEENNLLAAIDRTVENTSAVRKLSAARQVDIVFLADAAQGQGGPSPGIERKLKDHESEITVLRQEIEANALLFHAINSRRVLTKDILAVEFPSSENIVVYAASRPSD